MKNRNIQSVDRTRIFESISIYRTLPVWGRVYLVCITVIYLYLKYFIYI